MHTPAHMQHTHIHTQTYTHTHRTTAHTRTHTHTHTHTNTHTHTHTHKHTTQQQSSHARSHPPTPQGIQLLYSHMQAHSIGLEELGAYLSDTSDKFQDYITAALRKARLN
jgi:hypothetical protein